MKLSDTKPVIRGQVREGDFRLASTFDKNGNRTQYRVWVKVPEYWIGWNVIGYPWSVRRKILS